MNQDNQEDQDRMEDNATQRGGAAGASVMKAVDTHAHVMRRDAPLVAGRHSAPERDVLPEEFLAVLDAHGVSHGVLTQPSFYGADNSILRAALAAYPGRLRGTAILDQSMSRAEVEAMAADGVVGMRLNLTKRDNLPDLSTPDMQRLLGLVHELDWHVELFLESERLGAVLPALQAARVKVVFDHFGCPEPSAGADGEGFKKILSALAEGSAWVKLSAPYRLRGAPPQPYVDAFLAAAGPSRLLWGSDWPWVQHADGLSYQKCLDWLGEWLPDERMRNMALRDNPLALMKF